MNGAACSGGTIDTQSDADALSCDTIDGDVMISSNFTGYLFWDTLKVVNGNFLCEGAENMNGFTANGLTAVTGRLSFLNVPSLSLFSAPNLWAVGLLELRQLPALKRLGLTTGINTMSWASIQDCGLVTLEGISPVNIRTLVVTGNKDLQVADFDELMTAEQSITFTSNGNDFRLSLPHLRNVSSLSVSGASIIDLTDLSVVTGDLIIKENSVEAFNARILGGVSGALTISGNPYLNFLNFSQLIGVLNDISITNNTNLTSVSFPYLEHAYSNVILSGLS